MNTPASRRVRLHAQPIAEHRAAGERARRIDGDDADGQRAVDRDLSVAARAAAAP